MSVEETCRVASVLQRRFGTRQLKQGGQKMLDVESLVAYIRELSGESNESMPSALYHYTTAEVLDKLLAEDGDLRCTFFRDLNDSAEFWTGFDYFANYCKRNGSADDCDNCEKVFCNLKEKWGKLQGLYVEAPWVASFSTERDSLYQWVAYTDRQKGGVAIGFDKAKLEIAIQESSRCHNRKAILLPCFYVKMRKKNDTRPDAEFVDKKLDDLIKFLLDKIDRDNPNYHQELETAILIFSSIVKDIVFSAEHEWRIVVLTTDFASCEGAEVIAGKARLPLGICEEGKRKVGELISEIHMSPHGDQNRLLHSAMLPKFSAPSLKYKIRRSDLPYKGEKS